MYNRDTDYLNALESSERFLTTKIVIGENEFIDEIVSCSINRKSMANDTISIGEVISDSLTVTMKFYKSNRYYLITKASTLEVYHKINDLDYVPIGVFDVDTIEKTPGTYDSESGYYNVVTLNIKAYDVIKRLNTKVTRDSGELRNVVSTELTRLGLSISNTPTDSYSVNGSDLTNYTVLQLVQYTAGLYGMNVRATRDGNLKYYWYSDANYTIDLDVQLMEEMSLELDYNTKIDGLVMGVDNTSTYVDGEEVVTVRNWSVGDCTNGHTITHTNPFATESIVTAVYNKVKDFEFRALQVKYRGNTLLEKEDLVKVEDTNGDLYKAILSEHELVLTDMVGTISCNSSSAAEGVVLGVSSSLTTNVSGGSLSNRFNTIISKVAEIDSAYIGKAAVGTLLANYAKIDLANIDIANINVAKVKQLYAEQGIVLSLQAGVIDAATANTLLANISNATVQNQATKLLLASSLVAQEGVIESIKGSNLTLEDSNGNKILLDGATQGFYDSEGNLRVAIGDNTTGDFSIWVFDEDGNELFNPTGVTYNGLLQGDVVKAINTDGKVSLINSSRINMTSVVNALNGENYIVDANGDRLYVYKNLDDEIIDLDTSLTKAQQKLIYQWDDKLDLPRKFYLYSSLSSHLKASAIYYDEEEQTMDVLFADLKESGEVLQSSYKMSNGLLDYVITNVNPTALTTKPSDWDSAYYKYYSKGSDGQYYHLQEKEVFESGTFYQPSSSVTNLRMNPKSIQLIADNIDLTGKVTFNSFDSSLQSTINGKAETSDIPTKVSELTNDSSYATTSQLPDVSDMATKTELESGTTIINGGCITTGLIQSSNGKFSVNMSDGSVNMQSGTFSGSLTGASVTGATGTFSGTLSTTSDVNVGGVIKMLPTAGKTFSGNKTIYFGDNTYVRGMFLPNYDEESLTLVGRDWVDIYAGTPGVSDHVTSISIVNGDPGMMTINGSVSIIDSKLNGTCQHLALGDDAYLGDCNIGGAIGIRPANTSNPSLVFVNSSNSNLGGFRMEDSTWIRTNGTGSYKSIYAEGGTIRSDAKAGIRSEAGDFGVSHRHPRIGREIYFGVGSGGSWCGLYDVNKKDYMFYADDNYKTHQVNSSDRREKHDIEKIPLEQSASMLDSINPVTFIYNNSADDKHYSGIIAQDYRDWAIENNPICTDPLIIKKVKGVEEPEYISDITADEDEVKYSIDYDAFIPDLWNGWKYHQQKIKELEEENKSLKSKLDDLEARLLKLENGSDI